MSVRGMLGLVAGFVVAALGAAILGAYGFEGWSVVVSAVALGMFIAETVITIGRRPAVAAAATAALATAAGLVGAGWISTGHHLDAVPPEGWAATAIGAATAAVRVWWSGRARGSRPRQRRTP